MSHIRSPAVETREAEAAEELQESIEELRALHELQNMCRLLREENDDYREQTIAITAELEGINVSIVESEEYIASYGEKKEISLENISYPPYRKYEKSGFNTPSGKMEFASTHLKEAGLDALPTYKEPGQSPVSTPKIARDYPLILTTGARLPMTVHSRTYRLPWNRRLRPDHLVDIHPTDARKRGISQGDWVNLSTQRGHLRVKANLTEIVPPGVVNIAHGNPEADVNLLIPPDYLDPVSGFPGFKSLLCEVKKA